MKQQDPSDKVVAEAIECFQCLVDPDADPKIRTRWVAWLADPEHRAAYERVARTMRRPVPDDVWPSADEVERDTYDPRMPIHEHLAQQDAQASGWWRLLSTRSLSAGLVAVAVLLLAMVTTEYVSRLSSPATVAHAISYQTDRGETRGISLSDGSEITLGPLSEVRLLPNDASRSVTLVRGEALFTVTHDPARPFEVRAGDGTVQDIGTAFAVSVRTDAVTVTVVDGRVAVSTGSGGGPDATAIVERNQQISYSGRLGPVAAVDSDVATGWAHGRLAYIDRPLAEVVADLARYSTVDLSLGDAGVGALRYTGTIAPGAIDQWAATLAKAYPVEVERIDNRMILRSKPGN